MRVKQMFQKAASVAVGTAMALNMIAVPIGAKAEELPRPVVHFDFESDLAGDYFEGEGAVARRVNSPVIEQQAINGIVTHVARFDRGGEGYLQLFDTSDGETFSALDGKESFTITFWENAYDGTTSWPFFAMQNGSQAKDRKYVGVISRANYTRLEKQNGRNSGVDIRTVPDGWHHVAYVVNEAGGSVYVNGELAGTLNNGFALPDVIQSNPIVYLGYAAWNEFSNLAMDEFKIYDGELTEAQMKAEYENGIKGEKAPTISSSDDQIAVAEGSVLRVKAGTTASELKRVLTPDPEDAVITIYKDSTKGEEVDGGEAVTQTNVVEISKDNIAILYWKKRKQQRRRQRIRKRSCWERGVCCSWRRVQKIPEQSTSRIRSTETTRSILAHGAVSQPFIYRKAAWRTCCLSTRQ